MAPIVAPTICRFVVNGRYSTSDVVNLLDMRIDTTGSTESREDAIFNQAGEIINTWSNRILPLLDNVYQATSVSWIDLNSLDGSTGARTSTDDETWPQNGVQTGTGMPGAMAAKVLKNITAARGQRQGSMFLCGVNEQFTDDTAVNTIDAASRTTINTALGLFLGEINNDVGGIFDYDSALHVVHTAAGVFTSSSEVQSLTIQPELGTQVRRGPRR